MPLRFRLFIASIFVAAAILFALPRAASAQTTGLTGTTTGATITVYQEQSLPRVNADGTARTKRGLQYTPEGVNYQDCVDNISIQFPLQLSGFQQNGLLQAWATTNGTDCTQQTNRTGGYQLCWNLIEGIQLSLTTTVTIPVRQIMSGASPASPTNLNSSPGICGLVDLNTISVEFLYFDPGNTSAASASQTVSISVDTVGPLPPSGITTLPGDTRIYVNWDNISGEGGVTALTGVKVYCDGNGNTAIPNASQCALLSDGGLPEVNLADIGEAGTDTTTTTDDASTAHSQFRDCTLVDGSCVDDGGSDAGDDDDAASSSDDDGSSIVTTTTDAAGTCSSSNLTPPDGFIIVPNAAFDSCFLCGSITSNTGTGIVATAIRGANLVDNQHYAVAVAATDAFQNIGQLSPIICEYPEQTTDFWRNYKAAGGEAGGCDTAGDDAPLGSMAAIGGGLIVGLSVIRRRKKGKR